MLANRVVLRRAMRRILKRAVCAGSAAADKDGSATSSVVAPRVNARRPSSASGEGSRRSSTSRPAADILSHIQGLKDKERQVLNRGVRDQQPTPVAAGTSSITADKGSSQLRSASEALSRQERLAREEKMATQYRDQLQSRLREIHETAIDLGAQKYTMACFERQLFGSSSPKEAELLEIERINGVRSLIGLPPLPAPAAFSAGAGGVRGSLPGTPMYTASSPSNLPSPYPYSQASHQHAHKPSTHYHQNKHRRTTSFGEPSAPGASRLHRLPTAGNTHDAASSYSASRGTRRHQLEEDDMEQDMDLGMEEGELSEEGELAE
ncbi:hypothetical protein GGI02_000620 [Coemansia sp. RSA 2322]|nr:hypothetical protein GGI02_000620 [Coemansia sp. RSA 2322]